MRLVDLNPKWAEVDGQRAFLNFDCPKCPHPETSELHCECIVSIPFVRYKDYIGPVWDLTGDNFETLTISPSIFHHCKSEAHFFIRNGNIEMA